MREMDFSKLWAIRQKATYLPPRSQPQLSNGRLMISKILPVPTVATLGQANASDCAAFAQEEFNQESDLLSSGVLPESNNLTDNYTNSLWLRSQANKVLWGQLMTNYAFLTNINYASQTHQDNWVGPFLLQVGEGAGIGLAASGATIAAGGDPLAGLAVAVSLNGAVSANTLANDYNGYVGYTNAYFQALCSQLQNLNAASQILQNCSAGLTEVSQHITPTPITATINSITTSETGTEYVYTYQGPSSVTVGTVVSTVDQPTAASTTVSLKNTSGQSAYFEAIAFYSYLDTTFGQAFPNMPMVIAGGTILNDGETGQIPLQYYDGNRGAFPTPQTPIIIYVLGISTELSQHSYGVFLVSSNFDEAFFIPTSIVNNSSPDSSVVEPSVKTNDSDPANSTVTANPIWNYILQNGVDQNYQSETWIRNPLPVPLVAVVTQILPEGVNVVNSSGTITGPSIVWTNTIQSGATVEDSFTFNMTASPGTSNSLPPPTVIFTDSTGTNSIMFQSTAASFNGLFPVQVSTSIPSGTLGVDSTMVVALTNMTGPTLAVTLGVTLADAFGNSVTNYSEIFSLNGSAGTDFSLPLSGALPAGSYSVAGSLTINGGNGPVSPELTLCQHRRLL